MEISESAACSGGVASHRLEHQAAKRFTSHVRREGWLDFVFAFHDNDEIGPVMLARIAKQTGLTLDDL